MIKNLFPKLIIFTGTICLLFSLGLVIQRFLPIQATPETVASDSQNHHFPTNIRLIEQNIDLPVIPATPIDGKLPTTATGVSFQTDSSLPGHTGTSIFYGHNWPNLLGNLKKSKRGDTIQLRYTSGQVQTFTVDLIAEMPAKYARIEPNDSKPTLTIYTCSGFLDSKRLIVTANYNGSVL